MTRRFPVALAVVLSATVLMAFPSASARAPVPPPLDTPQGAQFVFTYANTVPAQALPVLARAGEIWSHVLSSPVPIDVFVQFGSLPFLVASSESHPYFQNVPGAPHANTRYPSALAERLAGTNLSGATPDITITFSTSVTWYYGIDGGAGTNIDLLTETLRAIGRGLGFAGSASVSGGIGSVGSPPTIFDFFVRNGTGTFVLNVPNNSAALGALLQSNDLGWGGFYGMAANGGQLPRLYAPNPWLSGFSYSNLDENQYPAGTPDSLMTPFIGAGEVEHAPGRLVLGMLQDMGWAVTPPAVHGDFDGDRKGDLAVFRPSGGSWYFPAQPQQPVQFGLAGDIPAPADYNGDRVTDIAVYRPSTGSWLVKTATGIDGTAWGLPGDVPVPGDYLGAGYAQKAVYRPSEGNWYFYPNLTPIQWGIPGDIPVPGDYDGDGKTDVAIYRPSSATLWIVNSATNTATSRKLTFGIPVVGNFDADGNADIAIFHQADGTWDVYRSSLGPTTVQYGLTGDIPAAIDFDGDGVDELCVWRPSEGKWFVRNLVHPSDYAQPFGLTGDIPVMERPRVPSAPSADFDGDGVADPAVWRPDTGHWYALLSASGYAMRDVPFGLPGDQKAPGDYDGDHRTDYAVFRPSEGMWYVETQIAYANGELPLKIPWGLNGDIAVPADYDGDGRTDIAVFRPSTRDWYVLLSSTGFSQFVMQNWGLPGDVPMPADFDGDGRTDLAVYRPSTGQWLAQLSSVVLQPGPMIVQWGQTGDVPVLADVDGDGRADPTVYRPSTGTWFSRRAFDAKIFPSIQWGLLGDLPVPHDYVGDGVARPTVFRISRGVGVWYVRIDGLNSMTFALGLNGDQPFVRRSVR